MKYLIANWKAQMTFFQVQVWTQTFLHLVKSDEQLLNRIFQEELKIIIAPPAPFIMYVKEQLQDISNISVASQTISHVEEGKYTGEITAKALQGIAHYSIIGHSERRSNFQETEAEIETKIQQCEKYSIEPILCIRDERDTIYSGVKLVAYEPISAIGTGENMNPQEVVKMKKNLSLEADSAFIYGGSADETNCKEYIATGEINGFLVGTASLDPRKFYDMAKNI